MLCEDMLVKKKRLFQDHNLILSDDQIITYYLVEIEKILTKIGKSLRDFCDLPLTWSIGDIPSLNKLVREELHHDIKALNLNMPKEEEH